MHTYTWIRLLMFFDLVVFDISNKNVPFFTSYCYKKTYLYMFIIKNNQTFIKVVKTRMQGIEGGKYKNTLDCFMSILRQEGIGGLYSGVIPRLYRVVPGQVNRGNTYVFLFFSSLSFFLFGFRSLFLSVCIGLTI
jgi:hypothetical protein